MHGPFLMLWTHFSEHFCPKVDVKSSALTRFAFHFYTSASLVQLTFYEIESEASAFGVAVKTLVYTKHVVPVSLQVDTNPIVGK